MTKKDRDKNIETDTRQDQFLEIIKVCPSCIKQSIITIILTLAKETTWIRPTAGFIVQYGRLR